MSKNTKISDEFLPKDYDGVPEPQSGYMKFLQGENKFRVLSPAITGYEFWNTDNKPVRSKEFPKDTPDIRIDDDGKESKTKHFWAMIVWNYTEERVQILHITQVTILRQLEAYVNEPDLGNPCGYDIKVTRKGEKFDTEYTVIALPPKDVTEDILKLYKAIQINLQALYSGEDPFSFFEKVVTDEVASDKIPF